jgi:hypothetical protein
MYGPSLFRELANMRAESLRGDGGRRPDRPRRRVRRAVGRRLVGIGSRLCACTEIDVIRVRGEA